MRTAHGGQLARLVGSPVVFVASTAALTKANSNIAEIEGIMLPFVTAIDVSWDTLWEDATLQRYLKKKRYGSGRTFATIYAFGLYVPRR